MTKPTEAELRRVIKVGSACADLVETLMENAKKADTAFQAEALFLSAVDSVVDGVFWHLTENKEDDMERHKFAAKVFTDLMMSTALSDTAVHRCRIRSVRKKNRPRV